MEEVALGRRLEETVQAGAALMQLELPYLDRMSPSGFQKLLADHEDELIRFRSAFKKLVAGAPQRDLDTVIEELRCEVAELLQSQRYESMRRDSGRLGGIMATLAATVAAAAAASSESILPVAATAGAAAATTALVDLWKQRSEREAKLRESPYFIVWKLGMDKASNVKKISVDVELWQSQRIVDAEPGKLADFHWLCPPTPGLRFLAVKR